MPAMVPAHVTTCPTWIARSGVRRVRSSWRIGRKNSASSTVSRPFLARSLARWGPTPLTYWSGVARPAGGAPVCLTVIPVLYRRPVPVVRNPTPRRRDSAALRCVREGPVGGQHDQSRAQAHAPALAAQSRPYAGAHLGSDEARPGLHALS